MKVDGQISTSVASASLKKPQDRCWKKILGFVARKLTDIGGIRNPIFETVPNHITG